MSVQREVDSAADNSDALLTKNVSIKTNPSRTVFTLPLPSFRTAKRAEARAPERGVHAASTPDYFPAGRYQSDSQYFRSVA